jgi:hypothetical protein
MLTFFEIQTLENWNVATFIGLDSANEIDHGPIRNNRIALGFLYVLFIFLTTFFILNTFITILISSY